MGTNTKHACPHCHVASEVAGFAELEQDRDTLRQQLAEAKGEVARLDTAWQKEREICQKAEAALFDANRRNAELEQQLQQANAASGELRKACSSAAAKCPSCQGRGRVPVGKLGQPVQMLACEWCADLRAVMKCSGTVQHKAHGSFCSECGVKLERTDDGWKHPAMEGSRTK